MTSIYPHGLRVFLKTQTADSSLHSIDFPTARAIDSSDATFFTIIDEANQYLGSIAIVSVSIILPIQPKGPSDADNQA